MIVVTSVNVNGIRAAAKKGFVEWLAGTEADVICLQEVRSEPGQLPVELRDLDGWHAVWAPSVAQGRAGGAILSRQEPQRTTIGFGSEEFDNSGRYVEIDLPGLTVASLYLPSGEVGTERQDEKERFMVEFLVHLTALRARAAAAGREVVVCGDWNIAHREEDLKNHKGNHKSSGFLPHEREWMTGVFAEGSGWTDIVRHRRPDEVGPYSWWSQRGKAFDNDAGWRIDYHVVTDGLVDRAVSDRVDRASAYDMRWSDHAPVTVVYE